MATMADSASQNRGDEVLAVTVALFVASTFAVVLRFISRIGIVKRVSMDDYFMIVSWVSGNPSSETQLRTETWLSRRSSHLVSRFRYATEHPKGWVDTSGIYRMTIRRRCERPSTLSRYSM